MTSISGHALTLLYNTPASSLMSNVMFTLLSHRYPGHSRLIRSCGKNIGVIYRYRGQERDSNTAALNIREVQIMLASVGTDSKLSVPRNGKHAVLARHAAQPQCPHGN